MGKKKVKTEQTNRPIYPNEIEGTAANQIAMYERQQPIINDYADQLGEVSSGILDKYPEGNPMLQAAQGYVTDTLGMEPGANPYLDDMIATVNDNTRRQIQTRMGTRGGVGGSVEADIVSRALANNETSARLQDYYKMMDRKAQAAGMAPGLMASEYIPLDAAMKAGSQGAMLPLNAALANSAGIGGLLGQYQEKRGEQVQSGGFWEGLLGQALGIGGMYLTGGLGGGGG